MMSLVGTVTFSTEIDNPLLISSMSKAIRYIAFWPGRSTPPPENELEFCLVHRSNTTMISFRASSVKRVVEMQ